MSYFPWEELKIGLHKSGPDTRKQELEKLVSL